MSIIELKSLDQLNKLIKSESNKVFLIDFHAKWCGPCHAIAPFYESMSKKFKDSIVFLKCDVDDVKDVPSHFTVTAMPTFLFLKNGVKIDSIRGADKNGLEKLINKHSSSSGSGSGSHNWGSSGYKLGSSTNDKATTGTNSSSTTTATSSPSLNPGNNWFYNLNPQIRLGLGLLLVYIILVFFKQ